MDVNVSIILAIYTTCPASRVLEANRSDQAVIGPPPIQTPDQNRMTPPLLTLAGCIFPVPMKMQTDDVLMVFSAFYYDSENFGYENAIAILNVAGRVGVRNRALRSLSSRRSIAFLEPVIGPRINCLWNGTGGRAGRLRASLGLGLR